MRRACCFELTHVQRLDEGIEHLATHTFDVLLLDLSLPDSQGTDTVKRMAVASPRIPVVVLTGTDDAAVGTESVQCGAQDYLVKGQTDHRLLTRAIRYAIARKRAEETLRESEERFRTMADGLPLMIWVHDVEGQLQFVNRTYCQFFGVTFEQVRGPNWQPLVHPDDVATYTGEFSACVRDRRPFDAEARVRRFDGEWRWIESWAQLRYSASGELLGMVGTSADITERKTHTGCPPVPGAVRRGARQGFFPGSGALPGPEPEDGLCLH